jgi:hypothetical protein
MNFSKFYETHRFITVFTKALHQPLYLATSMFLSLKLLDDGVISGENEVLYCVSR